MFFFILISQVDHVTAPKSLDFCSRGKESIAVDLKRDEGREVVRKLCGRVDVLLDPYRPSVLEKLGLGPKQLLEEYPALIVCRLTGFGQTGTSNWIENLQLTPTLLTPTFA